jgi:hypothetical protein
MKLILRKLLYNRLFSRIFIGAWMRHLDGNHLADYEVCRHWRCWLFWHIEYILWYWLPGAPE